MGRTSDGLGLERGGGEGDRRRPGSQKEQDPSSRLT